MKKEHNYIIVETKKELKKCLKEMWNFAWKGEFEYTSLLWYDLNEKPTKQKRILADLKPVANNDWHLWLDIEEIKRAKKQIPDLIKK